MAEENFNILNEVKTALGITGNYQDNTLNIYINDVKEYLIDAGVSKTVVESASAIGVIARGVSDLWNYGAGNASLSPYFMQRACQLIYKTEE